MASPLGTLLINIAANTSQLKTDLDGARKELGSFRGSVEGTLGGVGKLATSLLKLGGITLSLGALVKFGKDSVTAFAESERGALRLEAVLRATGNTAGLTAKELKELSKELSRGSLFGGKEILAATSQLLTFENISATTFKQAIRLSVDLASLWDGEVSAAAFALGKALQSPADAASLLGKAKVRLTEEEKKAIEQFVRFNDIASAQGVIVKALEDRVGGVAGQEASGLSGAFHRLKIKIDDARKSLVGFFVGLGKGPGLDDIIQQALRNGAGLNAPTGPLPALKLPDVDAFTSTENISKEIGGLTALAGIDPKRLTSGHITRLRELGRAHAEALRLPNLELEVTVRLARELKSIEEALAKLGKPLFQNFGSFRDQSRMGATAEEQAALQSAIANSRLSSAMIGVGGEQGSSPLSDERTKAAAALWRQTWVNAIEGTQEAFADFFMSIGQEGFKLVDLFKGIARAIQSTLAQMASQQIVNAIFGSVFKGITGPGGSNAGNVTQGGFSGRGASTVVNQNISFNVNAIDAASVAQLLIQNRGTIVGVVAQAAYDAPRFAQGIVAAGSR